MASADEENTVKSYRGYIFMATLPLQVSRRCWESRRADYVSVAYFRICMAKPEMFCGSGTIKNVASDGRLVYPDALGNLSSA